MFQRICQKTLTNHHNDNGWFPEVSRIFCHRIADFVLWCLKGRIFFFIYSTREIR